MRRAPGILASALALTLVGCGSDDTNGDSKPDEDQASAESTNPSESSTSTLQPEPEPDADGDGTPDDLDFYPRNPAVSEQVIIKLRCDAKGRDVVFKIDRGNPHWENIWSTPVPPPTGGAVPGMASCWADAADYGPKLTPITPAEQLLWDSDKHPGRYTISIPYEQCAQHDSPWMMNEWPVSAQQISEAEEALTFCPGHPNGPAIRQRILEQQQIRKAHDNGTAFFDGNYRVGTGVKPGTYYVENVENCYWERLDSAGEIIDNNFVSDAFRVEATIGASDYSFHSEGCGEWLRVR